MASVDAAAGELVTIGQILDKLEKVATEIASAAPQAELAVLGIGLMIALTKLAKKVVAGERASTMPSYEQALQEFLLLQPKTDTPTALTGA